MTNKHGRLWNKHFAVTFCGTRCYKVTEKKNLHTCLPEDETVESHSHGPHVQRLQESCHKEHLMWHGGEGAEKTYIAEIRKQTTLTGVGADGPPPVIYGTFFLRLVCWGRLIRQRWMSAIRWRLVVFPSAPPFLCEQLSEKSISIAW